jgi:hypothetical protein
MTTGNEEILNTGLSLAMEFGADWLKPIQDRLSVKYSTLTQMERVGPIRSVAKQWTKVTPHWSGNHKSQILSRILPPTMSFLHTFPLV